ncbi:phosphonate C-P lyase system protein PhnH [Maritalea sp. S77]|uniref:phosphonate C-P lyase system protein PhnH n=1 Tax=Maritalea sp. S77 TaxID=3415125 RepID=UPI003C7BF01D
MTMPQQAIAQGFTDLTHQSQQSFKAIMDAMAQPGKIYDAPHKVDNAGALNPVAAMAALTLCDAETLIYLDEALNTTETRQFLAFHTGAATTSDPQKAQFAFLSSAGPLEGDHAFNMGNHEYPDQSTTVIIAVNDLANQAGATLSGPGIETSRAFASSSLSEQFWQQAEANNAEYPLGIDHIFVTETQLAALPRSTKINLDPAQGE